MPIPGIVASGISGSKIATGAFYSIATVTAAGGETSLSFTSIPSTYKSLQIRGIFKGTTTAVQYVQFNSDSTAANYDYHYLSGDGTTAAAGGATNQYIRIGQSLLKPIAASTYGAVILDIVDYGSTTKYKTTRGFFGSDINAASSYGVDLESGLWLSTSAITSVAILTSGGFYSSGSTFALYGIN